MIKYFCDFCIKEVEKESHLVSVLGHQICQDCAGHAEKLITKYRDEMDPIKKLKDYYEDMYKTYRSLLNYMKIKDPQLYDHVAGKENAALTYEISDEFWDEEKEK